MRRVARRVGLVTYRKVASLTDDDRPLIEAFALHGVAAAAVIWDDGEKWKAFDALVLRSCWDYHTRYEEFDAWLGDVERAGIAMFNPVPLVRWNMNKRYLRELGEKGIRIADTIWLSPGDERPLSALLIEQEWSAAMVKPAISASAYMTFRADAEDALEHEARFRELVSQRDMLVQRLLPEVAERGEWSLVFIGGALSHSGLKRPKPGGLFVQQELGGSIKLAQPPAALVDVATRIERMLPAPALYARIDIVETDAGPVLMEIECIEPDLFFRLRPASRRDFVEALLRF
jgi:glutathione synthase/RimK-type ligase-like ATP-grasp enzyme